MQIVHCFDAEVLASLPDRDAAHAYTCLMFLIFFLPSFYPNALGLGYG